VTKRTDALPKAVKKEIRQLAGVVHERLLAAELAKLDGQFARWRGGEWDAFALAVEVHRFHEGAPRKLWLAFNTHDLRELSVLLRGALVDGTLRLEEATGEVLAFLEGK
jgi:hypothetical protein